MLVYATADDLEAWNKNLDVSSVDVDALLRSASMRVADAIGGDYYATDDTGLATDSGVLQALSDATCAQVTAWVLLKVDPAAGGVSTNGLATSVGIGSARKTYADGANVAATRAASLVGLVPEALQILRNAGLASTRLWGYG